MSLRVALILLAGAFGMLSVSTHAQAACYKRQLIALGKFTHANGGSTARFTDNRIIITSIAGALATRQYLEYRVSLDSITYTIVRARGSAKAGLETLLEEDFVRDIPIPNPGPHTAFCELNGSMLTFGGGTWYAR